MRERIFQPPQGSYFLLGPRGTGKTWLARERYRSALWVDLLDPGMVRDLSAHPERLREMVAAEPGIEHVVIDEVQKVPELLEVIHLLIEEERRLQFVLTGSSARSLRRAGVNLLGGRATPKYLHPYMATELGPDFSLHDALRFGMVPLVLASPDRTDTLAGYTALYMEQEVQTEGLVRSLGNFARFLEVISFSQASVLNLSSVARDANVKRKTAAGYLEILEDLLLAFRLPVFTRRAKRELAAHPKFYLFDAGVYRTTRPAGPLDAPDEIDGAALETLVAQHLRAWCDYSDGDHELYYWQTRSKVEVDFVIYGHKEFFAIEVKNSDSVRPQDLRGLKNFGEDYPEAKRILLYRGDRRFLRNEILCLPCEEFLRELRPNTTIRSREL